MFSYWLKDVLRQNMASIDTTRDTSQPSMCELNAEPAKSRSIRVRLGENIHVSTAPSIGRMETKELVESDPKIVAANALQRYLLNDTASSNIPVISVTLLITHDVKSWLKEEAPLKASLIVVTAIQQHKNSEK